MENKYMILASMYRYNSYFFSKTYTEKQYRKEFLAVEEYSPIPLFSLFRDKIIIKKSMAFSYGIVNKETYIETFEYFANYKADTVGAISNVLYQVFFMYGKLSVQQILALDNFNVYFNRACDHFGIKQRASLLEYFKYRAEKEIDLNIYYSIFERFREWVPLTKGNIFAGFDLARAVYISGGAFQIKYVSAKEVQAMINSVGEKTMRLFDSWSSFLASFIIGKFCWLAYDPDEACIKPMNESLYEIYGMITQSSDPLAKSGIWEGDDYRILIDLIEGMIKFDEPPVLPGNINKTDYSSLIAQHPELKGLVALIRKYPAINTYFARAYKKRYVRLIGEEDFYAGFGKEWIENQLEQGEFFLASSNVPWPVWLSNKSLYYRKGFFGGKIYKIPLAGLESALTFDLHDTYSTKQVCVSTSVCRIFELSYDEIKDNELASRYLGRKAEKEWRQFFMELKSLS